MNGATNDWKEGITESVQEVITTPSRIWGGEEGKTTVAGGAESSGRMKATAC